MTEKQKQILNELKETIETYEDDCAAKFQFLQNHNFDEEKRIQRLKYQIYSECRKEIEKAINRIESEEGEQ